MVGRPLDDRELVVRAQRGDADAYEELVHAYQGIALRIAYLIAGNAADAEEAAQDGFVKAHRALWRFRAGAPFKPWLLRIVPGAQPAVSRRRAALALRAAGDAAPGTALSGRRPAPSAGRSRGRSEPPRQADREASRALLPRPLEAETAGAGVRRGTVKSPARASACGRLEEKP